MTPGGQAPFLLLRVDGAAAVRDRLRAAGIAVRRGDTFPGLGADWLRIAVVAPEHHERIVDAFTRAAGAGPVSEAGRVTQPPGRRERHADRGRAGRGRPDHGARLARPARRRRGDRGPAGRPRPDRRAAAGVLLIPAGKAPGYAQLSQDEINEALIKHAAAGRRVARLKGGDPFMLAGAARRPPPARRRACRARSSPACPA